MANIETNITIIENTADALRIRFEIINKSGTDLLILKRNTPLEGIKTDCLLVLVNGEKVKYDGYLLKRGAPGPEDYVLVKAGETVSNETDISEAYDVSKPGTYEVKFDDRKLVVIPAPVPGTLMLPVAENSAAPLDISNQQTSVTRTGVESGKEPIGARMREEENKKKIIEAVRFIAAALQKPKIVGGTVDQKKIIEKAHKKGYQYVKKAIAKLENDNRYKRWFGKHTDARATQVKTVYEKVKKRMEKIQFSYHVTGGECDSSTYAYTTIGGKVIWLCNQFWASPDEGFESRAGTMVHEHSHASGETDDFEYSREDCEALAKLKPDTAIANADTYEFYSESYFSG